MANDKIKYDVKNEKQRSFIFGHDLNSRTQAAIRSNDDSHV